MSYRHTQVAVGLPVTWTCTSSRRPWAMNSRPWRVLKASVRTLSRSAAQISGRCWQGSVAELGDRARAGGQGLAEPKLIARLAG